MVVGQCGTVQEGYDGADLSDNRRPKAHSRQSYPWAQPGRAASHRPSGSGGGWPPAPRSRRPGLAVPLPHDRRAGPSVGRRARSTGTAPTSPTRTSPPSSGCRPCFGGAAALAGIAALAQVPPARRWLLGRVPAGTGRRRRGGPQLVHGALSSARAAGGESSPRSRAVIPATARRRRCWRIGAVPRLRQGAADIRAGHYGNGHGRRPDRTAHQGRHHVHRARRAAHGAAVTPPAVALRPAGDGRGALHALPLRADQIRALEFWFVPEGKRCLLVRVSRGLAGRAVTRRRAGGGRGLARRGPLGGGLARRLRARRRRLSGAAEIVSARLGRRLGRAPAWPPRASASPCGRAPSGGRRQISPACPPRPSPVPCARPWPSRRRFDGGCRSGAATTGSTTGATNGHGLEPVAR